MLQTVSEVQGVLADTVALAAVALIGYLFGLRTRRSSDPATEELQRELERARGIALDLQKLAKRIRRDVALHQGSVRNYQSETAKLAGRANDEGWQELSQCAERLLSPTLKLAADITSSYEELRRQTNELLTFTHSRRDPECGVHTRRALEEQLKHLFCVTAEPQSRMALALFSLTTESGDSLEKASLFARFAQFVDESVRERDFVARYGSDELAVIMPQTSLAGATVFAGRMIRSAGSELSCDIWGGVVEKAECDTPQSVLSRADSALYSARTNREPCLFQHTGESTRRCHLQQSDDENLTSPTESRDPSDQTTSSDYASENRVNNEEFVEI